jgi:hypothetical protein
MMENVVKMDDSGVPMGTLFQETSSLWLAWPLQSKVLMSFKAATPNLVTATLTTSLKICGALPRPQRMAE